ncbi:MAG TPA: hypothetical protein EYQ27_05710, partial [Gemmatimonadetes bacterium]|nr:hypothetical protein [Gemmatimonadota bacterium]
MSTIPLPKRNGGRLSVPMPERPQPRLAAPTPPSRDAKVRLHRPAGPEPLRPPRSGRSFRSALRRGRRGFRPRPKTAPSRRRPARFRSAGSPSLPRHRDARGPAPSRSDVLSPPCVAAATHRRPR